MNTVPSSPYKGLSAFEDSELDALLFFGRERESEIVVANLIASRLTVLYGPSGVGKSSLLRASVARSLRELPEEPRVILFDRWGDDPGELAANVAELLGERAASGLHEVVERTQQSHDVYLLLDQVEEYFVYQANEVPFEAELARVVGEPLRVNVLLSLREDSLARLDRFKRRIPSIYGNSLRLDRMDRAAGRMAITGPVERWNELTGERVEMERPLVEEVLDGVGAGQIELAAGGLGSVEGNGRPYAVEAPYLQLVMQRLWEEERSDGSERLRATTLEALGGPRQIVADHLERAVERLTLDERDVAAQLFTYLVTPSGTKIAHEVHDLAEYAGVEETAAAPVVATLSDHRIVRPDEAGRIEIFHDVLAEPVLAWRTRHRTAREIDRELAEGRRRRRRLRLLFGLALVALALMSAVTAFALSQRSKAQRQAQEARAHQLEAISSTMLAPDPELSLVLAREAARVADTETSETGLRSALVASNVRTVVRVGEPLLGAILRAGRVEVATASGQLMSADGDTGRDLATLGRAQPGRHVSFAANGIALFTEGDGGLSVIRPDGDAFEVPRASGVIAAEISSDASRLVAVSKGSASLIDVGTGRLLQRYAHPGVQSAAISRDNTTIATGSSDGSIRLWLAGGRQLRTVIDQGHILALAFSPDATSIASASSDGVARLWNVRGGSVIVPLETDASSIRDIGFSTDGALVVTGSEDGSARISWADTGATQLTYSGHDGRITSASFSGREGSSVVTASLDGTVRIWNGLYQPVLRRLARLPRPVSDVAVGDGRRIRATLSDGQVRVLDLKSGKTIALERGEPRSRQVVGPDGVTATIRGSTVVLRANEETRVLKGHRDRVRSVAFSPDGALLATASRDGDVRVWTVATGQSHALHHKQAVSDVTFSPDGRWLLTGAGRAALWDPFGAEPLIRLQGHVGPVTAVAFDDGGRTIVTGGADGTVRTYACTICGDLDDLLALADRRLKRTGRELTPEERERYLR